MRSPRPTRPTPWLRVLLSSDLTDDALLGEALDLLRVHPAMRLAQEHALAVALGAQEALAALPDSDARRALRALATGVVTRVG